MLRIAIAALVLIGCGGPSDGVSTAESGVCAARSGLYRGSFSYQSGNCGPQNEAISNASSMLDPGCTGMTVPLDACSGEFDVTCPATGALAPGTITFRGNVKWSSDGRTGTATAYMEVNAAAVCSGIYSVSYVKL